MRTRGILLISFATVTPLAWLACGGDDTMLTTGGDASVPADGSAEADVAVDAVDDFVPPKSGPCALPGSVVFNDSGRHVVPGGDPNAPSLTWLHLPAGFCAHHFAHVPVARAMRFAPGGELFVASPTTTTTGGGNNGLSAIMVVPDDDHDLVGDTPVTFASNLPSTQGMLFDGSFFYFQDHTKILRTPYSTGTRALVGTPEIVADITLYVSQLHWPKSLDVADDGTIYVSNGGDQDETCDTSRPFHGGILKLVDGGAAPVAKGLRNPIAVRCERGRGRCYATELAKDNSNDAGGREKLIPIRDGDDWGFPCCATKDEPYLDLAPPLPDCSAIVAESDSFVIGNTPFGFDFDPGKFPAPWSGSVFVTLHGDFASWKGAQIVAIATDADSGAPLPGTNLDGGASGAMKSFATGWDDGTMSHGRPSDVTFAPDGRMFVSNDVSGEIFWIAPVTN